MSLKTVGEKIKWMREWEGLTQKQLAKKAGIKWEQQISHIETGVRQVGKKLGRRLAQALDIEEKLFFQIISADEGDPRAIEIMYLVGKIQPAWVRDCVTEIVKDITTICMATADSTTDQQKKDLWEHLTRQLDWAKSFYRGLAQKVEE